MTFRFKLLPNSELPLFAQIIQQCRQALAQGILKPGDQLPTVRDLAEELVVNPNTVAKAYQDLEKSGITTTRRGAGTFIANGTSILATAEKERILKQKIEGCLTEAVHLGFSRKSVTKAFTDELEKFKWPEK
ncbi:MAG TPA: GntR family transcriptional regulator [Planctomycetota bacterium]|nr:GntR family transcriptional regulator [Planctomycetota bacterium]